MKDATREKKRRSGKEKLSKPDYDWSKVDAGAEIPKPSKTKKTKKKKPSNSKKKRQSCGNGRNSIRGPMLERVSETTEVNHKIDDDEKSRSNKTLDDHSLDISTDSHKNEAMETEAGYSVPGLQSTDRHFARRLKSALGGPSVPERKLSNSTEGSFSMSESGWSDAISSSDGDY
jgi:hypothetical protein